MTALGPQHTLLAQRAGELVDDASADVRALARLWQLRNKMGSVGGSGTYGALRRPAQSLDSGIFVGYGLQGMQKRAGASCTFTAPSCPAPELGQHKLPYS